MSHTVNLCLTFEETAKLSSKAAALGNPAAAWGRPHPNTHPPRRLLLPEDVLLDTDWDRLVSLFTSWMSNNAEHLTCLLAVCKSSLVKWLLKSSVHFLIGYFVVLSHSEFFTYSQHESFIGYVVCKYFFQSVDSLLMLFCGFFWKQKVFNFVGVSFIIFLLQGFFLLVLHL